MVKSAKKIAAFGEVLLRLSASGHNRLGQANQMEVHYGGSEANVVCSLSRFGHPTAFTSRLPENELGKAAYDSLRRHGVNVEGIIWGGKRLGVYFLETGVSLRASKVIYDRENSSFAELKPGMIDWKFVLEDVSWFHWSGITPALSSSVCGVLEEALKIAADKNIYISADLNYRSALWKYGKKPAEVMPSLVDYCDLLIGGNEDSEQVLGIPLLHAGEDTMSLEEEAALVEERCHIWKKAFPKLKTIGSTMRRSKTASQNDLAGAIWNGDHLYVSPEYQITDIVDRVGGGDAFVAGIIHGLLEFGSDFQRTVNFATAASVLKHTIKGDVNIVSVEEVERLISGSKPVRIIR